MDYIFIKQTFKITITIKLRTFSLHLGGSWVYGGNVYSVLNLKKTRAFSTDGYNSNNINPAVVYDNADIKKELILKDNQRKAEVYRRVNKANGKTYVGSAVNLSRRLGEYFNFNQISKGNMSINKALLKYGYSGFKLEILEYCEPSNCIDREQYYLDLLKPEYNILKTAGSSLGYQHLEEAKKRISEASLGRIHSDGAKKRISEAQKGNKNCLGRKLSEETKNKISEANKGVRKTGPVGSPSVQIEVIDLYTGIKTTYDSISEAARALGVDKGGISKYFSRNSQTPFKGQYKLSKV
jgi:group I intron endonuclease